MSGKTTSEPYVTHGHSDIVSTTITAFEQIATIIEELDKLGFEANVCEFGGGENMHVTLVLAIEPKDGPNVGGLEFRTVVWSGEKWMEFS